VAGVAKRFTNVLWDVFLYTYLACIVAVCYVIAFLFIREK
jgi:hypothetical protein